MCLKAWTDELTGDEVGRLLLRSTGWLLPLPLSGNLYSTFILSPQMLLLRFSTLRTMSLSNIDFSLLRIFSPANVEIEIPKWVLCIIAVCCLPECCSICVVIIIDTLVIISPTFLNPPMMMSANNKKWKGLCELVETFVLSWIIINIIQLNQINSPCRRSSCFNFWLQLFQFRER